jgi:hypothetical protein
MKYFKMGLCLAAMFAMSMVASATASAAPVWEHCTKGPVNAQPTKYSEHGCSTLAQSTGEWNWREVNGTEEIRIKGSLLLSDTKVPIVGTVSIECSGEGEGFVGPKNHDRITKIETSPAQCVINKNCEKIEAVEARDLPWQTEVYETEGKQLDNISAAGAGEPGWKVECKVLGLVEEDICTQEASKPESLVLLNKATTVGTETQLLVLATFQHLRKAKCKVGGVESGEVKGSVALLQVNGWGLKIS